MKLINTLITILFISLLSTPSWSVTMDDLVFRDGLYYEKFTDVPYTGKITGGQQVSFKNGVADGAWVTYYENGQLFFKGSYKNGKKEGAWVRNHSDGTLSKTLTGTYKDGGKISD